MEPGQVVRRPGVGVVGGGVGMAVAFLVAAGVAVVHGQSFDQPARLAASLVLGPAALLREDGALVAFGLLILAILGVLAGAGFAILCDWFPGLTQTRGTLVVGGATYAAFLWLVGFYYLGFLIWPWLIQTDPVVYALAAVAGGAGLGATFAIAGVHRSSQLD